MGQLSGKHIVVTAGKGRLGRAIARTLNRERATVVTIDRSVDEDVAAHRFSADLTNEDSVVDCFNRIVERIGQLDAVVHAAGTWAAWPMTEHALADWHRVLDANLTSAFLVFREGARHMARRNGGRLIGFSAAQGADRGLGGQAAYAASKAGLIRLVESIADEYHGRGVTAHAIAPSIILFDEAADDARGVRAGDLIDIVVSLITETGDALNGSTIRAYGLHR